MSNVLYNAVRPLQMRPTVKSVYLALADEARSDDGTKCFPSISRIMETTCLSKNAVIQAIKILEEQGGLRADRSNGRHTCYSLTPALFKTAEPVHGVNRLSNLTGSSGAPVGDQDEGQTSPPDAPLSNSELSTGGSSDAPLRQDEPVHPVTEPVHVVTEPVHQVEKPVHAMDTNHRTIKNHKSNHTATREALVDNFDAQAPKTEEQDFKPSRAVAIAILCRQNKVMTNGSNPRLLAWAEQGITDQQIVDAIARAKQSRIEENSQQPISPSFLDAIIKAPPPTAPKPPPERWWKTEAGIDKKARALGMHARGGESYEEFAIRIHGELAKRAQRERDHSTFARDASA